MIATTNFRWRLVPFLGLALATAAAAADRTPAAGRRAAADPAGASLVGADDHGAWFGAESGDNPRLNDAHRAFLEGRWLDLGLALKDVLATPDLDEVTRLNALDLLEQAYDATEDGRLFASWPLPRPVTKLRAIVRHKEGPWGANFSLLLKLDVAARGAVTGLKLSTPDGAVLLDRAGGVGEWIEEHDEDGEHVRLKGENHREPPAAGLYLVDVVLASGEATHGFFILNRAVSSAAPEVVSPRADEVVTTPTPTVVWREFRSPELKPFESRAQAVGVDTAVGDATPWEWWGEDMARTSMTVGDPAGIGEAALADGRYILRLSEQEVRRFGSVHVRRESIRLVPFSVKAAR